MVLPVRWNCDFSRSDFVPAHLTFQLQILLCLDAFQFLCDDGGAYCFCSVVYYEDFEIKINSSMGIASYPETCSDINDVLDRSDKAMYYSKEHGRGRITIDGREGEEYK